MLVQNDQVSQVINQGSFLIRDCSLIFHGTKFPWHGHACLITQTGSMGIPSVILLPDLFKVFHIFDHDCFTEAFLQIV